MAQRQSPNGSPLINKVIVVTPSSLVKVCVSNDFSFLI